VPDGTADAVDREDNIVAVSADIAHLVGDAINILGATFGNAGKRSHNGVDPIVVDDGELLTHRGIKVFVPGDVERRSTQIDGARHFHARIHQRAGEDFVECEGERNVGGSVDQTNVTENCVTIDGTQVEVAIFSQGIGDAGSGQVDRNRR